MSRALEIWRAGYVARWHTSPDARLRHSHDSVAGHHGRCAILLLALHPAPSVDLLSGCLHHDIAEGVVGDMPHTAKRTFPDLLHAYEATEATVFFLLGLTRPTGEDAMWVKLVDSLDAFLWMHDHAPERKSRHDWQRYREQLMALAETLGVSVAVQEILQDT